MSCWHASDSGIIWEAIKANAAKAQIILLTFIVFNTCLIVFQLKAEFEHYFYADKAKYYLSNKYNNFLRISMYI